MHAGSTFTGKICGVLGVTLPYDTWNSRLNSIRVGTRIFFWAGKQRPLALNRRNIGPLSYPKPTENRACSSEKD